MIEDFDVIVVGGGHAGCEAAASSARLGKRTLLLTMYIDMLAHMPCNPAIGGTARGQMVREIDALGGVMGKIADQCAIHYKLLNRSKGPAVQSPRAQIDRFLYRMHMQRELMSVDNLFIKQGEVASLEMQGDIVRGLTTKDGREYGAKAIILTTGTFLGGRVHVGRNNHSSGRAGEIASIALSECLKKFGLEMGRLKTGTPPRLNARSLDFSKMEIQPPDDEPVRFSFTPQSMLDKQVPCYMAYTTEETQDIVRQNLESSALYGGDIKGTGTRYCPSLEDKVVRFEDKQRHHIFVEPEGITNDEIYCNGLSNSLPPDVQDRFIRSIPGFEKAEVTRYGYAIEYDFVYPYQLRKNLEIDGAHGLFLAGQINGSSGYEEAAAQGLVAGVNAVHYIRDEAPFTLGRDQAYMGVLIDDLSTKDIREPYRMFTSSAEYRILLRHDDADVRLLETARRIGLISPEFDARTQARKDAIDDLVKQLSTESISGKSVANYLNTPEANLAKAMETLNIPATDIAGSVLRHVEIHLKYQTYLDRQLAQVERSKKMEDFQLPKDIDYRAIVELKNEAREKLATVRPLSLGQASRIAGISPADIAILTVLFKGEKSYPRLA